MNSNLTHIWEPRTVQQATREYRDAVRAYDTRPSARTQRDVYDALANLDDAHDGSES